MKTMLFIFGLLLAGCAAEPVPPRIAPEYFKCGIPSYEKTEDGFKVKHGASCR
jgi:hypothetical protein